MTSGGYPSPSARVKKGPVASRSGLVKYSAGRNAISLSWRYE
jgi:hypothetical protein